MTTNTKLSIVYIQNGQRVVLRSSFFGKAVLMLWEIDSDLLWVILDNCVLVVLQSATYRGAIWHAGHHWIVVFESYVVLTIWKNQETFKVTAKESVDSQIVQLLHKEKIFATIWQNNQRSNAQDGKITELLKWEHSIYLHHATRQ